MHGQFSTKESRKSRKQETPNRKDYRNDCRKRNFETVYGPLEGRKIPGQDVFLQAGSSQDLNKGKAE